jgi:hypothetical protein
LASSNAVHGKFVGQCQQDALSRKAAPGGANANANTNTNANVNGTKVDEVRRVLKQSMKRFEDKEGTLLGKARLVSRDFLNNRQSGKERIGLNLLRLVSVIL